MRAGTRGAIAVVAVVFAATRFAGVAVADDEANKVKARKLLAEGDKRYQAGEKLRKRNKTARALRAYQRALESYEAAYDAFPSPKIFFPIGLTEERLGRFLDALNHYQQLLDEGGGSLGDLQEQVEGRIERVKKNLVTITFEVEPKGAVVEIDGGVVGEAPLDKPHVDSPGAHTYKISADGHEPVEGKLDLAPGSSETVEVILKAEAVEPVEDDKKTVAVDLSAAVDDDDAGPDVSPWLGVGATVVLGGAAVYAGMRALDQHRVYDDDTQSIEARQKARDSGRRWTYISDGFVLATAAAGAYTVYLIVAGGEDDEPEKKNKGAKASGESAWLAPYAGPNGGGVAAGMTF